MKRLLHHHRFVSTLGVAGLGLGLLASTAGVPLALAQEPRSPVLERPLFQYEGSTLDLSDEELHTLLLQLLQEREQAQAPGSTSARRADLDGVDIFLAEGDHEHLRIEAYHAFTEALAVELGLDDADAADAAIRAAMMATVDANPGLSPRGAEAQKALIADAPVPIGPAYAGHGG